MNTSLHADVSGNARVPKTFAGFRYVVVIGLSVLLHLLGWQFREWLDLKQDVMPKPKPAIQVVLVPATKAVPKPVTESSTSPASAATETKAPEPEKPKAPAKPAKPQETNPITVQKPAPSVAKPKPATHPVEPNQAAEMMGPQRPSLKQPETKPKTGKPPRPAAKPVRAVDHLTPAEPPHEQKPVPERPHKTYHPTRREIEEDPNLPPPIHSLPPIRQPKPEPIRPPVHAEEAMPQNHRRQPPVAREPAEAEPEHNEESDRDQGSPRTGSISEFSKPAKPEAQAASAPAGAASAQPSRPTPNPAAAKQGSSNTYDEAAKATAAYLHNPKPEYPAAAKRRRLEGTVRLKVRVLASGLVQSVDIDSSSGHAILDQAAVEAVQNWRFVPAKREGKPVDSWVQIPLSFNLIDTP